ncbi:MAG: ABC transporter permease [Eubacteriales bacterium]|nr:ABC transporter permease [Eubacteriales bacterium]
MILFTIVPCLLIAWYSFTDANGAFTLDNFRNFWDSNYTVNQMYEQMGPEYSVLIERGTVNIDILVYSLWMAVLCTVICLLLGYPAAYCMADREMKLGSTLVVLFIIPMWMNFLLRTIAWMSLLEDQGLINSILKAIGVGPLQLMYNDNAVLLGMVYNFLPFMVFPIYTSLNKMDNKLVEAAQDLGANGFKTFWRVTAPLSVPGVISGITMVFMPSVTTFFIPRILGGGNTMMFGDLIENRFLTEGNWNVGSALSLVMMALILISLSVLRKADPEGEGGGIV